MTDAIRELPETHLGDRDAWGRTWLHRAAHRGDGNAVAAWLERGLDPNARDVAGLTPLLYACSGSLAALYSDPLNPRPTEDPARLQAVDALLAAGAEINARDPALRTPLAFAVAGVRREIAEHLLKAGADPLLPDENSHPATEHIPKAPARRKTSTAEATKQRWISDEAKKIRRLLARSAS